MSVPKKEQERILDRVDGEIRAITLWQPYASLVAWGLKKFETRSWKTNYQGKLLIHAAKRPIKMGEATVLLDDFAEIGLEDKFRELLTELTNPKYYMAVVAVSTLAGCKKMRSLKDSGNIDNEQSIVIDDQAELEKTVGLWEDGRFAWDLQNVQKIERLTYQYRAD